MTDLTPNAIAVIAVLFAVLVLGSLVRILGAAISRGSSKPSQIDSLKTWWVLALLFGAAVVFGEYTVVALFAIASSLAIHEFLNLVSKKIKRKIQARGLILLAVLYYVAVALGGQSAIWPALPALIILVVPVLRIAMRDTRGYVQEVGMTAWGFLLFVFCLSHAALLVMLPESVNPVGGSMGWLIYLVVLTQANDIAQALWGRQFGKHKVTPRLSPNKTWEGLVLGTVTTVALAIALGFFLTPFGNNVSLESGFSVRGNSWLWLLLAGVIVAVGGFLGDLNMSAVKRDVGVKDSGTMLPGQGGILDRIDSLTFTAPLFYYYVKALYQ